MSFTIFILLYIIRTCFGFVNYCTPTTNYPLQLTSKDKDEKLESSYKNVFSNLKFGYERLHTNSTELDINKPKKKIDIIKSQNALCYGEEIRQRGCENLFIDNLKNEFTVDQKLLKTLQLQSLPCVVNGLCPYSQFRCNKGHTWKAIHGSPVCFQCPVCERTRKVYGKKNAEKNEQKLEGSSENKHEATAERLLNSLKMNAINSGGVLLTTSLSSRNKWNSTVCMKCSEGHEWSGKVGNILVRMLSLY